MPARYLVAMDGEVREQKAPLPAGQLVLDPPAVDARDEASAQLDPRRR